MINYIFALLPLYVLVYLPISHIFNGPPQRTTKQQILSFNETFIATPDETLSCPQHTFNTYIISHEPLIIYIENFLTEDESQHLLKISEDKFAPSTVSTGAETSIQEDVRFSEVALLDRDEIVRCIEDRARAFQGWEPNLHIERLRTQRYGVGGHYKHHFDWSGASREADRLSTFMVYVDAHCEGGGTEFPRIKTPETRRGRWCDFLECGDREEVERSHKEENMGVTFKPITGNAVFWENIRSDGRGYRFFKAARYVFATKIIYKHAHNFTSALYHQTTTLHDAIRMPEISVALRRQITATRTKVRSPSESETSVQPLPSTSECDPLELVYNIRTSKFRTLHRSKLLTRDLKNVPLVKMQANMPPLLVDGRMLFIDIPKWKRKVSFLWRKSDGNFTKIKERTARLPYWVWLLRNLQGKFTGFWIENV